MKKSPWISIMVLVVVFIIGWMFGHSFCPITRSIRKAQNLSSRHSIEGKKEALDILKKQNEFIDLAIKKAQIEEVRKVIALSLGKQLIKHEMWLEAIRYLNEARQILPGDYEINYNLGVAYASLYEQERDGVKKNQYQRKAMEYLLAAKHDRPESADTQYLLGMMYYKSGLEKKAFTSFYAVLKKYPNDVGSLLGVARIHYDRGNLDKARQIYLKLQNILPPDKPKAKLVRKNLEALDKLENVE